MESVATGKPIVTHTRHAHRRMAQRGIRRDALDLVLAYGTDMPAGNGCSRRELHTIDALGLLRDGQPLALVEQGMRLVLILNLGEQMITCYRKSGRGVPTAGGRKSRRSHARSRLERGR